MLKRLARWGRRMRGLFPFTPMGVLVGVGSYGVLQRYGYGQKDFVLFALGALGVILSAVSLLVGVAGAAVAWWAVRRDANGSLLRGECDRWTATGFIVPSLSFLPLVTVAWGWSEGDVEVRAERSRWRLSEWIRPRRRSMASRIARRFEVGDAFGLVRIAFERSEAREVVFSPSVGALRQVQVVRGLGAGGDRSDVRGKPDGDPFDTRRYAAGDPIRFVLWKVFAKNRSLIVRTPEQAISPVDHTVAYLVAGRADEPAAGAARMAVEAGALGDGWRLGADGMGALARTREEALAILARSAGVDGSNSGSGLDSFVAEAGEIGRLVVFVPARPGPWVDRVARSLRARGDAVDFVVGTDGIRDRASHLRWLARDVGARDATAECSLDEVRSVVKALTAGVPGSRAVVVDRRAGRAILPEHLDGRTRRRAARAS